MAHGRYRDLEVWQKALDFGILVYQRTRRFPPDETYGMRSQIRRAATSIALNVAEGRARWSTREFLHFLSISQGSLAETETLILMAQRLGLLEEADSEALLERSEEIARMLKGLQRSLRQKMPT